MTKRREWPNRARTARDESAYHANMALKQLKPLLRLDHEPVTRGEFMRRIGTTINEIQTILRWLESVGAPIQLEE